MKILDPNVMAAGPVGKIFRSVVWIATPAVEHRSIDRFVDRMDSGFAQALWITINGSIVALPEF